MGRQSTADEKLRAVAHHEAGHFVAAYFMQPGGSDYASVTIQPSGDAAGLHSCEPPPLDNEEQIERAIVQLYAGYAAQVRFDPSAEESAKRTASSDDAQAEEWLDLLRLTKPAKRARHVERLRRNAAGLVSDHWHAVVALANDLLERTTVRGEEAACIVAIAEGKEARRTLAAIRSWDPAVYVPPLAVDEATVQRLLSQATTRRLAAGSPNKAVKPRPRAR
jgi:hypothetical protein